jgi:hypothetical protein
MYQRLGYISKVGLGTNCGYDDGTDFEKTPFTIGERKTWTPRQESGILSSRIQIIGFGRLCLMFVSLPFNV